MSEHRVITTQGRTGTVVGAQLGAFLVRWDDGGTASVPVDRVMALQTVWSRGVFDVGPL